MNFFSVFSANRVAHVIVKAGINFLNALNKKHNKLIALCRILYQKSVAKTIIFDAAKKILATLFGGRFCFYYFCYKVFIVFQKKLILCTLQKQSYRKKYTYYEERNKFLKTQK